MYSGFSAQLNVSGGNEGATLREVGWLKDARRQRSAYAPSFPQVLSRAIAARLQAEYIPPLGISQIVHRSESCPRARGKWPAGPKGVHEWTGKNKTQL